MSRKDAKEKMLGDFATLREKFLFPIISIDCQERKSFVRSRQTLWLRF